MSAAKTKRKPFYRTVTVDVDIDESDLEDAGYHHEDDCTTVAAQGDDDMGVDDNRQKLIDWHDLTHGLTLWASCTHEPCSILTHDFRRTH